MTKINEPRNIESMYQVCPYISTIPPPQLVESLSFDVVVSCSGSGSPLNGHSFCLDEQASGSSGILQADHRDVDIGKESESSGSEDEAERPGPFDADDAGDDGTLKEVEGGEPRLFESLLSVKANPTESCLPSSGQLII